MLEHLDRYPTRSFKIISNNDLQVDRLLDQRYLLHD